MHRASPRLASAAAKLARPFRAALGRGRFASRWLTSTGTIPRGSSAPTAQLSPDDVPRWSPPTNEPDPARPVGFPRFEVHPLTSSIGAEIDGVQLGDGLTPEVSEDLYRALLTYKVIFLRDQQLSPTSQVDFARSFGNRQNEIEVHPIAKGLPDHPEVLRVTRTPGTKVSFGETWHSDFSFARLPVSVSILYGLVIPPYGNDTLWANCALAWESLDDGLKARLRHMNAVHTAGVAFDPKDAARQAKFDAESDTAMKYEESESMNEEFLHPVARTHPDTGELVLYVNSMFTTRFENMTEEESAPLLRQLFDHIARPEFQCRFRWTPGSVAIWDNRSTQHIALSDNGSHERVVQRVTLAGDQPR